MERFEQKFNDFGQNEHQWQWHIKCMFTKASTCIYSIPYIFEEFFLTSETHMHENTNIKSLRFIFNCQLRMNSIWTTFSNITYLKCRLVSQFNFIVLC